MKITFKGKLTKINGEWVTEFTHLQLRFDDTTFLSISRPRTLIKLVALCRTKNYTEMSYEWFGLEDEA